MNDPEIELVFAEFDNGQWSWFCDCGAQNRCEMEPLEVSHCIDCDQESMVTARKCTAK